MNTLQIVKIKNRKIYLVDGIAFARSEFLTVLTLNIAEARHDLERMKSLLKSVRVVVGILQQYNEQGFDANGVGKSKREEREYIKRQVRYINDLEEMLHQSNEKLSEMKLMEKQV